MANYTNNLGQIRLGWRTAPVFTPDSPGTPNTIDSDSTNFILASGISDSLQISAIESLVADLKAYGLWTKMKAIYPFVGGSAASHKFNLKDPRDLDAAYRLVFNGGWTHTSNGAKPNGTTGYADTKLNTNILSITNSSFSLYLRTVTFTNYTWPVDLGVFTSDYSGRYGTSYISQDGNSYFDLYNRTTIANTNISTGFIQYSRTSSSLSKVYYKNTSINTNNNSVSTYSNPNNTIYLGALHLGSGLDSYSNREQAFISIGDGLSDSEAANLFTVVQKFQTTLGRHVGTPYVSDPDAIAFLMAAGITDGTQAAAINTLVIRMKADGVWTKMKAIYPFVGGTAASHKWNLKDPRDTNDAHRLSFTGTWVHSSTGAKPDGYTGYADTYLIPSTGLKLNNTHTSIYSRTNTNSGFDFGVYDGVSTGSHFNGSIKDNSGNTQFRINRSGTYASSQFAMTTSSLFYLVNRTSSSLEKLYLNGSSNSSMEFTYQSNSLPSLSLYIGAMRYNYSSSSNSNREFSFISFGDGLTDGESTSLYTAVQAFQTTLGRQVNVPLVSDTDAQAFLNAANITSFQQASAVNKLVIDLKASGVWSKMKAIYPFVGGSAASHKWNLKDPRDLDAAYRLVFNGGGAHSSTGYLGNGTNSYGRTFILQNSLQQNSVHLSYYNRYNSSATYNNFIGCISSPNIPNWGLYIAPSLGINAYYSGVNSNETWINQFYTSINKYWIVNRNSSTQEKVFIDGVLKATINKSSSTQTSNEIYVGAINVYGNSGINEAAFASIGDGLTDAESTALYTAVQTYQTSLGRGVNTPIYNNGLVLNLDAGNANSYPGTGTTWFDLAAGNNGTLVNGPTYITTNNGYINFDGINDNISFTSNCFNVPLYGTTDEFTINVWINWNAFPNNTHDEIVSWWASGTQTHLDGFLGLSTVSYLGFTNANPTLRFGDGWQNTGFRFNSSTDLNKWWNITAVKTANNAYIYVNSSLVATKGSALSWGFNNVLNIGSQFSAGEYLNAKLSNVQIYNRALSSTEILNNFNSTRGRFGL